MSRRRHDPGPTSVGLVEGARRGFEDKRARLYYVYAPYVTAYLRFRRVPEQDLDDLTQTVFEKVYAKLTDYEHDSFRGWLATIAHHAAVDFFRKQRREASGEIAEPLNEVADHVDGDPLAELERAELPGIMRRAIQLIRPEFSHANWAAFEATALDGENSQVAAARLNQTSAAVRKAKSRILRRLREELGDL